MGRKKVRKVISLSRVYLCVPKRSRVREVYVVKEKEIEQMKRK